MHLVFVIRLDKNNVQDCVEEKEIQYFVYKSSLFTPSAFYIFDLFELRY